VLLKGPSFVAISSLIFEIVTSRPEVQERADIAARPALVPRLLPSKHLP
jgi:hypothetical protein